MWLLREMLGWLAVKYRNFSVQGIVLSNDTKTFQFVFSERHKSVGTNWYFSCALSPSWHPTLPLYNASWKVQVMPSSTPSVLDNRESLTCFCFLVRMFGCALSESSIQIEDLLLGWWVEWHFKYWNETQRYNVFFSCLLYYLLGGLWEYMLPFEHKLHQSFRRG